MKKPIVHRVVIVGNGVFPKAGRALEVLQQAPFIICCDGAVDKLTTSGLQPSVVVGDCDSMLPEDLTRWQNILHIDKSEAYNDLQKALKYCLSHNLPSATLVGCDGLRDDHFIANLSIMATYSETMQLEMITGHGTFAAIRQTTSFPSTPGQQVSIFTTHSNLPLTFHGLKYPVNKHCFKHLWEGSLNEALGDEFTIKLHGEGTVIVYFTDTRL